RSRRVEAPEGDSRPVAVANPDSRAQPAQPPAWSSREATASPLGKTDNATPLAASSRRRSQSTNRDQFQGQGASASPGPGPRSRSRVRLAGSATPQRDPARGGPTQHDRERREVLGLPGPLDAKVLAVVHDPAGSTLLLQGPIASGLDVVVGEHDRAVAEPTLSNNPRGAGTDSPVPGLRPGARRSMWPRVSGRCGGRRCDAGGRPG